ncbi:Glutamate-ammonia-ligase adenylyltransferase [invertebrate metagenome]|uniref:Glutamate-ammonia-ligase adenylyltransferase n=1 Tax=invertebrate metagenome TaxID=1711999 RepID=A0A484HCZ2_9ZZZZ
MSPLTFPFESQSLPRPADDALCCRGMERWFNLSQSLTDASLVKFVLAISEHPVGRLLLEAVFGNSPFLSTCLLREPQVLQMMLTVGADQTLVWLMADLRQGLENETDTGRLMRRLRVGKRQAALLIGLADITELWPLRTVTAALSLLAETATVLAVRHLLRQAAAVGEILLADPEDPERDSGYVVLGMGKCGAKELNYSSDIDLVVLYDEDKRIYTGRGSLRECFIRLTRNLVRILSERTAYGYVFRTDLRLRPDPGSTAIAVSITAAELYYESFGQNWERAAMAKARCLAGDRVAGAAFLKGLKPYIWRRSLDFAAIQDIHSIKRQIHTRIGSSNITILGHDIKLGRGGIREIEFFTQTQQLIWGGREPSTRSPRTCEAILALATAGHVDCTVAEEMIACYRYLRRLEHRLQMVDDQQTQTLPKERAKLNHIATFMGAPSTDSFVVTLRQVLETVERHYANLFEEAPDLSTNGNLVFTGAEDDPSTLETLCSMGFANPAGVSATVRGWHHGRYRAVRTSRHRELLTELMPTLLTALARTAHPDLACMKFDEFLRHLPDGAQIFSLFYANPHLLDLVAEILGDVPRLAEWLSRAPALLDAMLTPGFLDHLPGMTSLTVELESQLAEAEDDYEATLDTVRYWANDRRFQVGVQILLNLIHPYEAGRALTMIADAALAQLCPRVEREFARQHGYVPSGGLAIIAMGKMGGYEMTARSDLDLILVYEVPEGVEISTGPKPLQPTVFYTRIAQRFVNAITAMTKFGRLYEVDMRLRPSGNKGPLAVSLQAFEKYQAEAAWSWEHMALTRARVVYGPPQVASYLQKIIRKTLLRPRDPAQLVLDVADMRERLAREKKVTSLWMVKHVRGGLVDIEFIVQYLQLRDAPGNPQILSPNTATALRRIQEAGLLQPVDVRTLLDAHVFWMALHGLLRQSIEGVLDDHAPPGLKEKLCRVGATEDFEDLKRQMEVHARRVYALFEAWIEIPARHLRGRMTVSGIAERL